MPNPQPHMQPSRREVPENLDELVRKALAGGSIDQVKRALVDNPTPSPVRVAPPPVTLVPVAAPAAQPAPTLPPPPPPTTGPLAAFASAAAAVHVASDRTALLAALDAVDAAVAALRADAAPAIRLPPIRHRYALAIGPCADAATIGQALEIDPATARSLAASPWTRIALRSGEPDGLERRAARARAAGIAATVLTREQIAATPVALSAVHMEDATRWGVVSSELWAAPPAPDQVPDVDARELEFALCIVVGEVESRVANAGREQSRWERKQVGTGTAVREHRALVIDLHLADEVVRVVEGLTELRGVPGAAPGRSGAVFRQLVEALPTLFPGVPIEPRRVCTAGPPTPAEDGTLRSSGWPTWEEHSRVCRLMRTS